MASLWALQTHPLDEVWWMPTYQHAFGKALLPFEERVALAQLATRHLAHVRVSQVERELGGQSRTIDTVRWLRQQRPDVDLWLIVGADILGETHKWKDWEGLMTLVRLIVVGRRGYEDLRADDPSAFALPQVSSTAIRQALAGGLDAQEHALVSQWMDHRVLSVIRQRGWYREPV